MIGASPPQVDFVIPVITDRAKGVLSSTYGLTGAEALYWWLPGNGQATHHLADFALAKILAVNR